jgi:hypothetical protein
MSDAVRLAVVTVFMVGSGVLDSLAFTYSAQIWREGKVVWPAVGKAAVLFAMGISMYWGAVRYLNQFGVVLPEIQTLIWFSATMIGVTLISGRFLAWPVLDQIVAVNVLVCLGWLIMRTSVA